MSNGSNNGLMAEWSIGTVTYTWWWVCFILWIADYRCRGYCIRWSTNLCRCKAMEWPARSCSSSVCWWLLSSASPAPAGKWARRWASSCSSFTLSSLLFHCYWKAKKSPVLIDINRPHLFLLFLPLPLPFSRIHPADEEGFQRSG